MHNIYTGNTKNIYLPCHVIRYTDTRGYDLPIITVKTHWKAHNFFFISTVCLCLFWIIQMKICSHAHSCISLTTVRLVSFRRRRCCCCQSMDIFICWAHVVQIYIYIHELCVKLGPLCYCCHSMVCILYINDDNNSAASHNLHL